MLSDLKEPSDEEALEVFEHGRVLSTHDVQVLLRELEGRFFEADVAWRVLEVEAEVDVDQVALRVNQYVSIVTIFDIEQVLEDTIASHAFNKVPLRCFEVVLEVLMEEGAQVPLSRGKLLLQVVHRVCVGNELKNARVAAGHEDLIGTKVDREVVNLFEDLVETLHQLNSQDFLAHVVVGLDDHGFERPGLVQSGKITHFLLLFYYVFEFVLIRVVHAV